MATIGVIDDRKIDREMIVDGMNLGNKEPGWRIIDIVPLPILDEYPGWISQNKVCAIVLDELLDEKVNDGQAVSYRGHDLVDYIRQRFASLPIFVITAHSTDAHLQERFKDVEGIIDREMFGKTYNNFVPRIIRSAQQYLNIFQDELSELSNIAKKSAIGEIVSEDEQSRAQAIQTQLNIAYSIDSITCVSSLLKEAESLVIHIEELRKELKKKLGD